MQRGKASYNIGEVAKISGMSIKTLRYYDQKGVLVPTARDESSGYRHYSEEQLLQALTVREMKLRGFALEEMKQVLDSHSLEFITRNLDNKIQRIQEEIAQLERQMLLVENSRNLILGASAYIRDSGKAQNPRKFSVGAVPRRKCIFTRYLSRICVREVFWDRFADIYQLLDQEKYVMAGPIIGVFHEHYTRQFFFEDGDLEIILPILDGDLEKSHVKEFGGFLTASCVYVGFYSDLLQEYVQLIKWIERNGYDIVGDPMEEYLVEFTHGVDESGYVTRISFPVEKKKVPAQAIANPAPGEGL